MPKLTKQLPTFAFVHGAWHGAWCWEKVRPYLEKAGYPTLAMDLPIEDQTKNFDDYATVVINAIKGPEEVILVGHSRGANVLPRVANRLGTVTRLVYLCAPLPHFKDTANIFNHAPRRNTSIFKKGILTRPNGLTYFDKSLAPTVFYNECSDDIVGWALRQLRDQSKILKTSQLVKRPTATSDYIFCSNDQVINPDWCKYVAHNVIGTAPIEIPGDHSPFLSHPEQLAQTLLTLVGHET